MKQITVYTNTTGDPRSHGGQDIYDDPDLAEVLANGTLRIETADNIVVTYSPYYWQMIVSEDVQ